MDQKIARIRVGVVTSAHGIRGQVKIRSFLSNPEDIFSCDAVSDASGQRQFKLTRQGIQKSLFIASIEGISDRNTAELLKGTEFFAPARPREKRQGDPWSREELIGLEVRCSDGKKYGEVIGMYNFGAGDILDIKLPGNKTEMLPLTKSFIGDIKPEEGYLIVFPPDYVTS